MDLSSLNYILNILRALPLPVSISVGSILATLGCFYVIGKHAYKEKSLVAQQTASLIDDLSSLYEKSRKAEDRYRGDLASMSVDVENLRHEVGSLSAKMEKLSNLLTSTVGELVQLTEAKTVTKVAVRRIIKKVNDKAKGIIG
jgi:GTP1/Obg family GTP-binding protein